MNTNRRRSVLDFIQRDINRARLKKLGSVDTQPLMESAAIEPVSPDFEPTLEEQEDSLLKDLEELRKRRAMQRGGAKSFGRLRGY